MGWKDIAKLGREWADAKKTELLTTDNQERERARAELQEIGRRTQEELGTSAFEAVLPEQWSRKVSDARPENVAAREAEERRERLADQPAGRIVLTVSGGEDGTIDAELPVSVEERPGWLAVRVEAPEPVALGSTTLGELSLAVPGHVGPGRYDLVDLMRRGEAGEIEWWEAFELFLAPGEVTDDTTWYVDLSAGQAWIEVGASEVGFELPMQSAVNAIRVRGTVTWS